MKIEADNLYHVYNQGNNRETIFKSKNDYNEFLENLRKFVCSNADILAYALMPNHFHFLINTTSISATPKQVGNIESSNIQNAFRVMLSSYAKWFNTNMNRTGSLFRQKTKFKQIKTDEAAYVCFNYIHQNPLVAKLCDKIEDWEYSSFRDYLGLRSSSICKKDVALRLLDIKEADIYRETYLAIPEWKLRKLY